MKTVIAFLILLIPFFCTSCAFDENRTLELELKQSIEIFHQRFNDGHFKEIYDDADDNLKKQFTEEQFTILLKDARSTIGIINTSIFVSIKNELFDGLRRTLGGKRKNFSYFGTVANDYAIYGEHIEWSLQNTKPKLLSYELKQRCKKPCAFVFTAN